MTYSGPLNPKMLLVGEAFGADEEKMKMPLVGISGQENWRLLGEAIPHVRPDLHSYAAELCDYNRWGLAWIRRRDDWLREAGIGFTNVINERPPDNKLEALCGTKTEVGKDYNYTALTKGKYLRPEYFHHLDRLKKEIEDLKPNVTVLMGNTACWALLGTIGITDIRGTTTWSQQYNVKCLPTFHPASLLYEGQWSNRPIIVSDFIKAYRESQFPEIRRPSRRILISPSFTEVFDWITQALKNKPPYLTVDCETSGGIIDTIGFAATPSDCLVIPFGPHRFKRGNNYIVVYPERNGKKVVSYWSREEELQVWRLVKILLESDIPKVFQNGLYDLQYLLKMGIKPGNCKDDTMLAWHALYPESRKSLGFLGSILCDDMAWKKMQSHKSDTEKRDE